jgi:hypothetical protein
MSDYPSIHPFWRALVGAGFGFGIGLAGYIFGFGAAIVLLILVILGGIVGVLAISGE